jgi:signal transduction histidine kinase/CheY-like chemotaxis protein
VRGALLALLVLIGAVFPVSAAPIVVTDAPRLDLTDKVEWCEGPAELDVAAVAAGGCRFSAASADALKRGVTKNAMWLRLTLINPASSPVGRWLQIGHPRLTHVSFFERRDAGWRRNEAGMAVPIAKRQIRAIDPILPVTLASREHRTILIRVISISAVDAHPTLWRPDLYQYMSQKEAMTSGVGIGALFATALFILAIYVLWKTRAYLYLAMFVLSIIGFSLSHSGFLQFYLWPADWPFDLRVQAFAGVGIAVFFALFVCDLVEARTRYRRHYALTMILTCATVLAVAWTCLIDYRSGALAAVFLVLATIAVSALLLLRRRLKIPESARIPLIIIGIFMLARSVMMALRATRGISADNFVINHGWIFLLTCLPAALIGLILHKQRMQMQLQDSQAESAARVSFLARMSHELRTPLDVIIGTAQLLSRPGHRARIEEGLADISANGRQLLKMIDEVLDYSRGLIGKLSIVPEPVAWPEFLRNLEHNARVLAARNGNVASLNVSGEALTGVRVDEKRLKQILDNLVANAARHTKNGFIRVDCSAGPALPDGGRQLEFAVSDSGEGILSEDIERIFQPFERGGNAVPHGGKGVGMGLAISRQLVELMGGKLTVESKPGKGASFRFQIVAEPADQADIKAPLMESISDYEGLRRTILVVDDEADNRAILAAMLRETGFDAIEADSGQAAVACCAKMEVDAVLTDQFMADGDGWFVLQRLTEQYPDLPIVLISAAPPNRPAGIPADIEFAETLLKPLDHSEVLRCLGDLLGLTWIETASEASIPAEPELAYRPSDLEELREMIEAGRVSDIMVWAEELAARDQSCLPFAERVRTAAGELDFTALRELAS